MRQPKGIPVGGQFAPTAHTESGITLATAHRLSELELHGPIPAALPGQTYADGTPVPDGSFAEAYEAFFRPLDAYENAQGPYQSTKGPTGGELQDLAGLTGVNLGRERGTYLEEDVETGDAVIVVHTRNGGGNRECWGEHADDDPCTGCIQEDIIPTLPTYLRDEDDDGDRTYANNFFRAVDVEAGRALVAADRMNKGLSLRNHLRRAIADGKCAPWEILSQVHGESVPYELVSKHSEAVKNERSHSRYAKAAEGVLEVVEAGMKAPEIGRDLRGPVNLSRYNVSVARVARYQVEATEARAQEAVLSAEMQSALLPAVKALASAELDRLARTAHQAEALLLVERAKVQEYGKDLIVWAERQIRETSAYASQTVAANDAVENFHWARSWPGELADCPPRPSDG
ncbi:hypothetical protein ACQCSX_22105 (plasmid) [Pseudarthrobacter sp. P1]|uniref:hypothetical protein n=1 Tax=Pseudarthrobacter sp. P1 TaxID=3418418 RepID=UPI003CE81A29